MKSHDAEVIIPAALRKALRPTWPGLIVGRTRDSNTLPMVTVLRAGGIPRSHAALDSPRLMVNVYADTEIQANQLADAVRTALEGLSRTHPIKSVTVSGPTAVANDESLPQRYLQADALIRRPV